MCFIHMLALRQAQPGGPAEAGGGAAYSGREALPTPIHSRLWTNAGATRRPFDGGGRPPLAVRSIPPTHVSQPHQHRPMTRGTGQRGPVARPGRHRRSLGRGTAPRHKRCPRHRLEWGAVAYGSGYAPPLDPRGVTAERGKVSPISRGSALTAYAPPLRCQGCVH